MTDRDRLRGAVDAALAAMRGMFAMGKPPAMQWAIFVGDRLRAEVFPPAHGDDQERFLAMRVAVLAAAMRADMITVAAEAAVKPIDVEQIREGTFVRPNEDPTASQAIVCIGHTAGGDTLAAHQILHRDDRGATSFHDPDYRWNQEPMLGTFADALRAAVWPVRSGDLVAAHAIDPRTMAQYLSREEGFVIALLDP